MRKLFGVLALVALVAAACSGGDTDDSGSAEAAEEADDGADGPTGTENAGEDQDNGSSGGRPGELPAECVEAPFEIDVNATGIAGLDGPLTVAAAYGTPQPIVPDPELGGESGNEQTQEEFLEALDESKQLAAETDLLLYAIWLADFPFDETEIAFLGGPDPLPGGTVMSLSIVPTSEEGFVTGDVITASDEFAYDTFTTFGAMGSYMVTDLEPEAFALYSGDQTGTAEILYLDEEWICLRWDDVASTRNPDGDLTISGVILAPLTARQELPFN